VIPALAGMTKEKKKPAEAGFFVAADAQLR
jgi:hypothetical protein